MDRSDSESSNDEFGLLKKALDVHLPEDFNPNAIPQNGEEYLQHVIYERTKKCKKWVTAEGDFTKFNKNQTVHVKKDVGIQKALEKFYPTKEWQENAIHDFIQLRNFIRNTQTPESNKDSLIVKPDNAEHFIRKFLKSPPRFSEITQYCQAAKVIMLHVITMRYLYNFDHTVGIPDNLGTWIYGILALLEKPLTPDCCFKLREFAKKCASVRATFQEDVDISICVPLNLYICIIARYFNQLDIAD